MGRIIKEQHGNVPYLGGYVSAKKESEYSFEQKKVVEMNSKDAFIRVEEEDNWISFRDVYPVKGN